MIKLVGLSISGIPDECLSARHPRNIASIRTRTALRAEITQDDHSFLTLLDGATFNRGDELVFRVKAACLAGKSETLLASDLSHGPARRQIAFQDTELSKKKSI